MMKRSNKEGILNLIVLLIAAMSLALVTAPVLVSD